MAYHVHCVTLSCAQQRVCTACQPVDREIKLFPLANRSLTLMLVERPRMLYLCQALMSFPVAVTGLKWTPWLQGCHASICMPVTTPDIKVDAVRRLGGSVELVGETYSETQTYAQVKHNSLCVCSR